MPESRHPSEVSAEIAQIRSSLSENPQLAAGRLRALADELASAGDTLNSLEARRYECYAHILDLDGVRARLVVSQLLREAQEARAMKYIGISQMYMGVISADLGEYEHAFDYHSQALSVSEEIEDQDLRARVLFNLGNVLYVQEKYLTAKESFDRSLELLDPVHERWTFIQGHMSVVECWLGEAFDSFLYGHDYSEALRGARAAFDRYRNLGDPDPTSKVSERWTEGLLCALEGEVATPEAVLGEGANPEIYQGQHLYCLERLSQICLVMGDFARGIDFARAEIELAGRLRVRHHTIVGRKKMACALAKIGRADEAFEFLSSILADNRRFVALQSEQRPEMVESRVALERIRQEQAVLRLRNSYLAQRNQELEKAANIDLLSGCLNRRGIEEAINRLVSSGERTKFAVALVDVDFFKNINDGYGHAIGDEVIRGLGKLLERSATHPLHVGRWGGEEFLILIPALSQQELFVHCEQLLCEVRAADWRGVHPDLAVSVSIGMSLWRSGMPVDAAISLADRNLYHSKRSGRDQFACAFEPPQMAA